MMHLTPVLALSVPGPVTWVFAANTLLAVFSAINVVAQQNPVHSALFLIANFVCIAVYYLLLSAQFLAAVQVIVYAGAIMMLFLFVITLLSPGREETGPNRLRMLQVPAIALAIILGIGIAVVLMFNDVLGAPGNVSSSALGTVQTVGTQLFRGFLFPFEVTSLLLLVALLGAIVLAKRRLE
jgi:NADH-quinone oxidoreductase subunit J